MAIKRGLVLLMAICVCLIIAFIVSDHLYVYSNGNKQYVSIFNDSQSKQLPAAKKGAFKSAPLKNRDSLKNVPRSELEKVSSCRSYKVAKLTHSVPYLTPKAKHELDTIAYDFKQKVNQKGLPNCRLLVTSLLRVNEDIEHLRENNANSVTNSTHLYGTTFDISWNAYPCINRKTKGDEYLKVLAEVLQEHKQKQKVYVKYETRQRCFHITAR